mgnify:CR=1 FL=1
MNSFQKNNRWVEVLKGILALIIGIICLANPATALAAVAIYLGIIAIITGVVVLLNAWIRKGTYWRFWISEGLFNLVVGILLVAFPQTAVSLIIILISLLIIAISMVQILTYSSLRRSGFSSPVMLVSAIFSLVIGLLLLFNPFEGAQVVAIILGVYAVLYSISSFYVAYRLFSV